MEGVSGITDNEFCTPGKSDYPRARLLMTEDANAAVEGAIAGGANNVLVNDSHGPMRNILIEHLNPRARLLSGSPKPLSMMEGILSAAPLSPTTPLNYGGISAPIGPAWDMAFFVGYHGRAGTANAIIDHTWTGVILEVFLNGREVGEIGLNAALAGYLGVPVALVTGDDRACAEAVELLGDDLQTAVVKRAVGRYAAECLGLEEARGVIREAAQRAVAGPNPAPLKFEPPFHLAVGWQKSILAEAAATVPGSRRVDARHVEMTLDNMVDIYLAWRTFNNLASTVS
jgi:D-amino peptidase